MYVPPAFDVKDRDELLSFVARNGFAQLVSVVDAKPDITHLPLLVSEDGTRLRGHLARANPHWQTLQGSDDDGSAVGTEVLAVFSGPHGYISPSWYEAPGGVPTWNYQAVHVTGSCRVFTDAERLRAVVDALTEHYEREQPVPWQPAYGEGMLQAIVGLEITIESMQGKFKLGQNRSAVDRAGVVAALDTAGNVALADAMRTVDETGPA